MPIKKNNVVEVNQTLVPPSPKQFKDYLALTVRAVRNINLSKELCVDFSNKY